jgi:hypothetical protein
MKESRALNRWISRLYRMCARAVLRVTGRSVLINRGVALPLFWKQHKRFPRRLESPRAVFEDYLFYRKIRSWSSLEEACVDKEYAKRNAANLCPEIRIPATAAVLPVFSQSTPEDLARFLEPYLSGGYVAKPAHSSGRVLFLKPEHLGEAFNEIEDFLRFSRQNFFHINFESQYARLQPKILVEERLGPSSECDYRFFSSRGKVLYCQFDRDRFVDRRQALFTVPDFTHIAVKNKHALPNPLPLKPPHWEEMLRAASALSGPFDFVRVDLYDLPQGVYFGEFTFTPCNTNLAFDSPAFSRRVLEDILRESRPVSRHSFKPAGAEEF